MTLIYRSFDSRSTFRGSNKRRLVSLGQVRMLGRGRPFVLELQNARCIPPPAAYAQMQESVNSRPDKWVSQSEPSSPEASTLLVMAQAPLPSSRARRVRAIPFWVTLHLVHCEPGVQEAFWLE